MSRKHSKVRLLYVRELLDSEFVREVLERKGIEGRTPLGNRLHSSTSATLVRNKLLKTLERKTGRDPKVSDFVSISSAELKSVAGLGQKTMRWLEDYLNLFGIVLPQTTSVHGMSKLAREVLDSL